MSTHTWAISDEMEAFSFQDAQANGALLTPADRHVNRAMASRASEHGSTTSTLASRENTIHAEDRQVEVVYAQQREEEEVGPQRPAEVNSDDGGEEVILLNTANYVAKKQDEKESKEKRRIEREAQEEEERRQRNIVQALEARRSIRAQQSRLDREGQLCASWSAGRSGSEAVGRQISGLWQSSRPNEKQIAQRDALIKDAEQALEKKWPGCGLRLVPFGSTKTGLIEAQSDVDLTLFDPIRPFGVGTPKSELELPPKGASNGFLADSIYSYGISQLPDYYSVNMVASALRRFGKNDQGRDTFIKVTPISKARVPIVKFVYSSCGLSSDINVNDGFGIVNSEMLAAYCQVDTDVVRPFLFTIKKWASRRGINDPSGKTGMCSLNSYTICLIAIQFLQLRGVVPNLQSQELISEPNMERTCLWQKPAVSRDGRGIKAVKPIIGGVIDPDTGARRFDTTFVRPKGSDSLAQTKATPPMSIYECHVKTGTLLKDFFIWLSEFNFDECGFSVRMGRPFRRHRHPMSKAYLELPYMEPPSDEWVLDAPIQCQDPFIVDRNTAGAVKMFTRQIIIDEACRARAMLEEVGNDVSTLLSELLVDYNYEEEVRKHERMMQSLDSETRSIITGTANPRGDANDKPRKKNKGKGKGRQR